MEDWFSFQAKKQDRAKAKAATAPRARPVTVKIVPAVERLERPAPIEVVESDGIDGADTIIQKVRRFWDRP